MTIPVTKTPSRTVPIAETMSSIGRGFPDKLVIFKIPASSFWWVRYYTQKKILKKSTKTENKKIAIEFAKKFYEDILLRERKLLPLGSSPIFKKIADELIIEQEQLIERGERSEYSLYQKDLVREATKFLREVEKVAKKEKSGQVVIIAVVKE